MKRVLSLFLSIVMLCSITVGIDFSAYAISDDYLYWSQTDSTKPWYSMSIASDYHSSCTFGKYGCWIMSYNKMLVQCGAVEQESFGPVQMINWIHDNNLTDIDGNLVYNHQNRIANAFGINYLYQDSCYSYSEANNRIMEYLKMDYYMIVRLSGHTVVVDNKMSKQNGYATISNSWNNSNYNVPLSNMQSKYSMQFIDVFEKDTVPPVVSRVKISNVTNNGFRVSCNATDNVSIKNVLFRIYLPHDSSFKMIETYGVKNGDEYSYQFNGVTKTDEYYVYAIATDKFDNTIQSDLTTQYVECINKCATPKISAKNTSGGKNISITDSTKGSTIYYKTSKNAKYKKYSKPIKTTSTKTIYAYAKKSGYKNSSTVSKKITVSKVATPKFATKKCSGGKKVSLSTSTSAATIYYKTSKSGKYKKYSKPFKITSTKTIYVYAKKSGYKNSSTISKKITPYSKVAMPKVTSKNCVGGKNISISTSTKGAAIYYKTSKNGKYKKYSKPIKITSKKTIYTYAKKKGYKNSSTFKKTYSISKTAKPTGVSAKAVSSGAIKINWKKVKGASGYYIYRSTSKKGTYKKVATISKGSILSKTDSGLSSNKTYYYKVKAYTLGKKTSDNSVTVSAKTKKISVTDRLQSALWYVDYSGKDKPSGCYYFTKDKKVWMVSTDTMNIISNTVSTYRIDSKGRVIIDDFGLGANVDLYLTYKNGKFTVKPYHYTHDSKSGKFESKSYTFKRYSPTINRTNVSTKVSGIINIYADCLNGYMGVPLYKPYNGIWLFDDIIEKNGKTYNHVDCSKNYIKANLNFALSSKLYAQYYNDDYIIINKFGNYTSTYMYIDYCKYGYVVFGNSYDSTIKLKSAKNDVYVVQATAYYGWEPYATEDYTFTIKKVNGLLKIDSVKKSNYKNLM